MRLGAGQRAGIAAKKGKMRREFLAKRHGPCDSSKDRYGSMLRCPVECNRDGRADPRKSGRTPSARQGGTNVGVFCFQTSHGPIIRCRDLMRLFQRGGEKRGSLAGGFSDVGVRAPRGVWILTFPEDKKGGDEIKPQSKVRASHITPERRGRRRPPAGEVGRLCAQSTIARSTKKSRPKCSICWESWVRIGARSRRWS